MAATNTCTVCARKCVKLQCYRHLPENIQKKRDYYNAKYHANKPPPVEKEPKQPKQKKPKMRDRIAELEQRLEELKEATGSTKR